MYDDVWRENTNESNEFFPKWMGNPVNLANSGNLMNHSNVDWGQYKDPVSQMCLAGTVRGSLPLTQEVAGWNPFMVMTNILVTEFNGNI